MKIFLLISVFISSFLFANEELNRIQNALRAEIARLQQASNLTIADVDALAEQFIAYLVRIAPTDAQLVNFRTRLEQVLNRVPEQNRQGRTIQIYEGQYLERARTVSMARASVSMQRAQSVAAPVEDRSALAQLERENMQHIKSRATSPSNVIVARRIILAVLSGQEQVASEANRQTAGNTYLGYALKEIREAISSNEQDPDAAREFQSRMLALELFARRLSLADLLNSIRRQRDEILTSIGYQRLLGNTQQILNRAIAARSVSRVPGISNARTTFHYHSSAASRAGAQERSDSSGSVERAGDRRQREEQEQPGNQAPVQQLGQLLEEQNWQGAMERYPAEQIVAYYNEHEELVLPRELRNSLGVNGRRGEYSLPASPRNSGVRAALSSVPVPTIESHQQQAVAVLSNRTRVQVNVVENAGDGDCLFFALGTTRNAFAAAIAQNRWTNQNLASVFSDGISANHPAFDTWYDRITRVDRRWRRLGDEYEVGLWHALTGIPVRVFQWNAQMQTWNQMAFHHQYTTQQQAERWIGYIPHDRVGENGHWVELRVPGTLQGNITLELLHNLPSSLRGA